ncbi:hypothetical protein [Nocardia aurantiaca]|uniref:Uncharacterized protein n=1 Tax=Nocardia aurantiaca TaxID=2675850 RepID=A0A6I3KS85_9NOCA|nr:hypothetical protein [Nocardia aurantiaca]MTE12171.1 hypothetical protein [Nocardia aurantiaca]
MNAIQFALIAIASAQATMTPATSRVGVIASHGASSPERRSEIVDAPVLLVGPPRKRGRSRG